MFEVAYFPNASEQQLLELYNDIYQYLIIDFGCDYECVKNEFLRSGKKIIVGNLTDWKREYFERLLKKISFLKESEHWDYLCFLGGKSEQKEFGRLHKITIRQVPFEPDPFLLHRENLSFFNMM